MNENETGMTFSLSHFSPLGVTFSLSIDSANFVVVSSDSDNVMTMSGEVLMECGHIL